MSPTSLSSPGARHAIIDHADETTELLQGLNITDGRDDRKKPSVHRISEHEKASASLPQRKQSDGPYFRVVKSGSTFNGPLLESFPNGATVLIIFSGL